MSDIKTKLESKAKRLVKNEYIVWLTTVDSVLTPQPRPVWFIWENDSFLIFSQPDAYKIQHIKQNAGVSLHFNTDETGDKNVIVYKGKAVIDANVPPAHKIPAYIRKYRKGILELGMTPEEFSDKYSSAIRVSPTSLRGW
jgi:PPOX class probable F420-dependent enzyme